MAVTYDEQTRMPRSDATNAYDLLADVCTVIRDEPLRYDQGEWLLTPGDLKVLVAVEGRAIPACGTVGCRAGWVAVLAKGGPQFVQGANTTARRILGAGEDYEFTRDIGMLFDASAVARMVEAEIGTPEYAEEGARGIEEFMERWADRLKATPVRR